jgi:hypothetical protein
MAMGNRLGAEFIGTFWLVLGGCGSAVLAAAFPNVGIGLLGVALAFGLTVLTMAFAIAHTHRQILPAPFAVGSAGGILAAKSGEIVHDQSSNFPLLGSLLVALGAVMADIARMFNHNRPLTEFRPRKAAGHPLALGVVQRTDR